MKHALTFLTALLLAPVSTAVPAIIAAIGFAAAARAEPPNPGFEDAKDGALKSWTLESKPIPGKDGVRNATNVRAVWDTGSRSGGQRCLRMQTDGQTGDEFGLAGSAPLKLLPGFEYDFSFHYKAEGLLPETGDRSKYAALICDIFCNDEKRRIGGDRIMTTVNSADWARLSKRVRIPAATTWTQIRFQLVNKFPGNPVTIWMDDVAVVPSDAALPNPGFETLDGDGRPAGWTPFGAAKSGLTTETVRGGKRAAQVSDAPAGLLSGWSSVFPVRPDRAYTFAAFARGGDLAANGFIGGAALSLQFLDDAGQPLGKRVVSQAVPAKTDWTRIATSKIQPPAGAASARLVAGLEFCNGTAWFDDFDLVIDEVPAKSVATVAREPKPDPKTRYAVNLLRNGEVEEGADGKPVGWTHVGTPEPDWTQEAIARFHTQGRPDFSVGRSRGEWSRELTYSGQGALLNISVDPPNSPNHQWYGRNPVDGYWLSDPMPCEPGTAYLAAAWIKPGAVISEAWHGPLELFFYDKDGKKLAPKNHVRCGLDGVPPGAWSYWISMPWVAPDNAASMRLRFGQELKADKGGWGRTFADNLAVWKLSETGASRRWRRSEAAPRRSAPGSSTPMHRSSRPTLPRRLPHRNTRAAGAPSQAQRSGTCSAIRSRRLTSGSRSPVCSARRAL